MKILIKKALVYLTNNKLNDDRNTEKEDYFKNLKLKKSDYKLNKKTLYIVSNIKYYDFFNYF